VKDFNQLTGAVAARMRAKAQGFTVMIRVAERRPPAAIASRSGAQGSSRPGGAQAGEPVAASRGSAPDRQN
jgi:hypothetical protein